MSKLTIWFLIVINIFVLVFFIGIIWFQSRNATITEVTPCDSKVFLDSNNDISGTANLPILSYCEVVNNPSRYNGKIVRISAHLSSSIHGMIISEQNCLSINNQGAVTYNRENTEKIEQVLNDAKSVNERNSLAPVNIIAIGKFEKKMPSNKTDALQDTSPVQFEIMQVEKASKSDKLY